MRSSAWYFLVLSILALSIALPTTATADDSSRLDELEREVRELRQELQDQQGEQADQPAAESEGEAAGTEAEVLPGELPPPLLPALSPGFGLPELQLRGFGHVQYEGEREDPTHGSSSSTNNFALGGVDLFITSQISDSFSFLNETLFEFDTDGSASLDVERVLLKYHYTEWLEALAGRGHTPIGYWNDYFHHGTWLQTTTDRPILFRFEDEGGILPVHFVGLEAMGAIETSPGVLTYEAVVANGRGKITDQVQVVEDVNDGKAVALLLRWEPYFLPGLSLGANAYVDWIPPDDDTPGRNRTIPEQIYGGSIVYREGPYELMIEGDAIRHYDRDGNQAWHNYGGYAQIAYRFGKWKPYYRFDILEIDEDDPFFQGLDGVEDQTEHTVGVRWDVATYVALKLEYRRTNADSADTDAGTLQASFAF